MTIGKRIKNRREALGMTQDNVAKKVGCALQTIYKYENEIVTNIPLDKLEKIADALDATPAALMGWNDYKSTETRFPSPDITEAYTTFPVIGEIAAGYDHIAAENWDGEKVDIPNSYLKGRNREDFFVLLVTGDSMYPEYQNGDKVLVLKQTTMDYSGQIGCVLYNDDFATLKRVEYATGEDWMRLVAINPAFPPIRITDEDLEHCRILGIPKLVIREV